MMTLSVLKDRLYSESNPVLYTPKNKMTEDFFVSTVFPKEFYSSTFSLSDGHAYSLATLLTKRGNNAAQRNKIFNRKYDGYILRDSVVAILTERPDIWEEICRKCKNEISKASDVEHIIRYLNTIADGEITDGEFVSYLHDALTKAPENALAAVIIFFLLNGTLSTSDESTSLLDLFRNTKVYDNQFHYMQISPPMLKRTFGTNISIDDYPVILKQYYIDYSELLSFVATVKVNGKIVEFDSLLDYLYGFVSIPGMNKLIRISGPSGSEKNAVTQLLYLKLACDVRTGENGIVSPHYINLNFYNSIAFEDYDSARARIEEEFKPFTEYCAQHPNRIPVLFVDGVKNYSAFHSDLDYVLNELISGIPNIRIVVATEDGVVSNPARQRSTPTFAAGEFQCQVSIESLYLPDSEHAEQYLKKFRAIYASDVTLNICESLRQLGLTSIDTFQLRLLLPRMKEFTDISNLYSAICSDYLSGDTQELSAAAQWAFDFSYTDRELPAISHRLFVLLTSHESFQEYFIANWYLSKIREESHQDNIGTLNMVMPKEVTRFIVPILNRSVADEERVLSLIERNYYKMGLMAKSEMTYWLGRIKSTSLAERAEKLLKQYYEDQKCELSFADQGNYKQKLFLMRGISVSLIVKGHVDISDEYIHSLINNELANEINRGFHLEYYGDKTYLPSYDTLNFLDDITSGKRTLDQLITANEISMRKNSLPPVFELNLFTICSLLQARTENTNPDISFDIIPYLEKAREHISWYLNYTRHFGNTSNVFREYLLMVYCDFDRRIAEKDKPWNSIAADSYSCYSKRVLRSGWVERGIPYPETVAEHMYHCWMMGMMFLPESLSAEPEYSKEKVLKLLLIHDAAEAVTGDILKYEKQQNDHLRESQEMGICLLRSSYPSISASNEEYYNVWQLWNSPDNINGRVAREIDIIQTLFTLLTYVNEYPDKFEDSDLQRWLMEFKTIRTAPSCSLLRSVIVENHSFSNILVKYGIIEN